MKNLTLYKTKKGNMIALEDLCGDEDYYRLHRALTDVIQPDDCGYSVDSMCIGGYFVKGNISFRTSSESPFDCPIVFYDPKKLSPEQEELIMSWVRNALER